MPKNSAVSTVTVIRHLKKTTTMKTSIRYSKLLQIGLLLTFFLPFFPPGCEPKQAVEAPMIDSTVVAADTVRQNSMELTTRSEQTDTLKTVALENTTQNADKTEVTTDDNELSTKISKKSAFLRLLLRPNNNYTGIASLIDCYSFMEFGYGLGIALILWLIALIVKIKDYNNIFHLLNILGLVFMYGTHSMFYIMNEERLWGFWVCIIWSSIMIIYDTLILLKIRRNRIKTGAQHTTTGRTDFLIRLE